MNCPQAQTLEANRTPLQSFRPRERTDYRLTPQERHLLWLLIDGHRKKAAARAMGISINTVSFHLKNLYAKLRVHSKTEAVVKALQEGLVVLIGCERCCGVQPRPPQALPPMTARRATFAEWPAPRA
jgi:DNA-binding CsgD family transcriptional regulator